MNTPLDLIKDCKFTLSIYYNIFHLETTNRIGLDLFEDKNSYYIEIKINDYILFFVKYKDGYFLNSISFENIRDCIKFFDIKYENIDFFSCKRKLEEEIQQLNESIKNKTKSLQLINEQLEQIPFEFE